MIPLYKLENLPRIQKLRKIGKMFTLAENRLSLAADKTMCISNTELAFFADAAKMLTRDTLFSEDACKAFTESENIFQTVQSPVMIRRALNNIKHILLTETGRDQADWDFTDNNGNLDPMKRQIFEGMQVYMEDIRSPFNVGAMFRTAESFGAEKIILSPFCADPRHRRAERTAMGCIDIIPWERRELFAPGQSIEWQVPVFALETGGIPINEFTFPEKGLLITGSEELGVSPQALAAADVSLGRVSIPCYGTKASLNVSTAFGIAMQFWCSVINKKKNTGKL